MDDQPQKSNLSYAASHITVSVSLERAMGMVVRDAAQKRNLTLSAWLKQAIIHELAKGAQDASVGFSTVFTNQTKGQAPAQPVKEPEIIER